MMKRGEYVSRYTDSDYKYKIGQFVRLSKCHNKYDKYISNDNIYEIVLRHIDRYGTEHYRLKSEIDIRYLDEFWQIEKNKKGELMFEPLTIEESDRIELKREIRKYNI
jgi:hypothetical protein